MNPTARLRPRPNHRAFTLIELLVVISIIVLLLSLLAPAMDRAIYQAELAVCGANQKGVIDGVNMYAMDSDRKYPHRRYVAEGQADTTSIRPWLLRIGDQAVAKKSERDDRIPLRGYMSMKIMVDPLCQEVNLDDPTSWIYSSYALWFSWQYNGQAGMNKFGGKFSWVDDNGRTHRANWLITDADNPNPAIPWIQTSHPDELGLLYNMAIEGGIKEDGRAESQVNGTAVSQETNSKWVWWTGWDRGEMEMNAGAADGSVTRINDVRTYDDERMTRAPLAPGATLGTGTYPTRENGSVTVPQYWINIPRQ